MTMLTRWDPFRELTNIHDRMNRLFQGTLGTNREEALSRFRFGHNAKLPPPPAPMKAIVAAKEVL